MRNLKKEEQDLIMTLLKDKINSQHIIKQLPGLMVVEMQDGEMGSLKFISDTNKKKEFGIQIAEITLSDADGTPVSFAVNLDKEGYIYELDVFKADFSKLIKFPLPPYIPLK